MSLLPNRKITMTKATIRFNHALEAADIALVNCADEVTNPDSLVALLMWCGHVSIGKELSDALSELEKEQEWKKDEQKSLVLLPYGAKIYMDIKSADGEAALVEFLTKLLNDYQGTHHQSKIRELKVWPCNGDYDDQQNSQPL